MSKSQSSNPKKSQPTADGRRTIVQVGRKIRLLGNNILIAPINNGAETSPSGRLWLAEAYSDDRKQYYVLAVGPGKRNKKGIVVPTEINVGDKILTNLYFSHHTMEDGTGRKIINADHIEAVIP
jgi:chaperonin GroES